MASYLAGAFAAFLGSPSNDILTPLHRPCTAPACVSLHHALRGLPQWPAPPADRYLQPPARAPSRSASRTPDCCLKTSSSPCTARPYTAPRAHRPTAAGPSPALPPSLHTAPPCPPCATPPAHRIISTVQWLTAPRPCTRRPRFSASPPLPLGVPDSRAPPAVPWAAPLRPLSPGLRCPAAFRPPLVHTRAINAYQRGLPTLPTPTTSPLRALPGPTARRATTAASRRPGATPPRLATK